MTGVEYYTLLFRFPEHFTQCLNARDNNPGVRAYGEVVATVLNGRTTTEMRDLRVSEEPAALLLLLANFLQGKERAAEIGARLALEEKHSLTDIYETLRLGVYCSSRLEEAPPALRYDDLDDRVTRLATRLSAASPGIREPQALILSTKRRGISACLRHIFSAQEIPARIVELSQLAGMLAGGTSFSRRFPAVGYIVVDGGRASGLDLFQHGALLSFLHLVNDRVSVVILGDDESAFNDARRRGIADVALASTLPAVMLVAGVSPQSPLTPREHAVLELISQGATNQQTAAGLGISLATVKTYLERAQVKLKSIDRASTVATALRRGWL
jgi:DNA-binding CsgD family transcriptional regulator